jgi:hypothetical protein
MNFNKWKKRLLMYDKILIISVILLLGIFRPDIVLIVSYFVLIVYLLITKRKTLLFQLLISSLLSLLWMLIARNEYGYNQDFLIILGINTFPFFSFSLGLFALYLIYSHYEYLFKNNSYIKKLLFVVLIYFPLLIILETIAYHYFNIRNISSAMYIGLPICDCLHASRWMQASYFLMGPLYFTITYLLKFKNPHIQKLFK